jgi:Protein of unknown function (DUF4435)
MNKQFYENIALNVKLDTQLSLLRRNLVGLAVRVENEKDESFWRPILEIALPNKSFEFYDFFSEASTTKGKTDIRKYIDYADKDLIFCIDADYDYLLQNTDFIGKPFVFHTYVYALENIFSYAEGLKNTLEKALNTEGSPFDYEAFFKNYSTIIYDWLCYSLYSEKIKDGLLSRDICGKKAGFIRFNNTENDLAELKIKLEKECEIFTKQYELLANFKSFKIRLNELGLTQNNAYLFLRGHDLFEGVTIKLLKYLGYNLLQNRYAELKQLGRENEIENLNKLLKTKHFERILRQNQAFQSNSYYKNIVSDIQKAYN